MKYLTFTFLVVFISGCAYQPNYQLAQDNVILKNKDKHINIQLSNPVKIPNFNNCVFDAYTLNDEKIHIEYIDIKSQCSWNGLASGFYQDFLNTYFKSLKTLDRYIDDKYDISFYETKDEKFYFISLYDVWNEIFILDYTGEIASKLNDKFHIIGKQYQLSKKLDKNMLDDDMINQYFYRESKGTVPLIF